MPPKIVPCLWFDHEAEEAARFYTSVFRDGKIHFISRYPDYGKNVHGRDAGSVMTVDFEVNGQRFTALNGGPLFQLSEAGSFQVMCASQEEIDYYWEKLGAGGDPGSQQCGWLKDRFGLSWQITPTRMMEMMTDPDEAKRTRAFKAMLEMKKMDLAALEKAFRGD